jgi:phage-related protein
MALESLKTLTWLGDSKRRLTEFPDEVRLEIGYAIYLAECGDSHPSARRMQGYNAVEIVSDYDGNAFRGVYTTKFKDAVYVLHCFQKKSKKGVETPKPDLDLIKKRLQDAKLHYEASKKHGPENQS